MSFAVPAQPARTRPAIVSAAAFSLFALAAFEVITVVLALLYAGKIEEGTKKALENTGQGSAGTSPGVAAGSTVAVIFGFIIIVIAVVLGYLVSRGNQVGRVLTWVLGGIVLCCSVVGVGFTLAASTFWQAARDQDPTLPTWDQYQADVYSAVPSWYQPLTTVLGILGIIAIALPIILLMLPAAHPFFRKQLAEWEPPTPGYPGQSGQPGSPGQPGQPGEPGYPPAPGPGGYPPQQ